MVGVELSYVDDALAQTDGAAIPFWRHFHWGLFEGPDVDDDSPARYYAAAEAMTRQVVVAGEVADGARVLDVGCGFGGTLDLVRTERQGCRLAGINIDERQLRAARRLLARADAGAGLISFVTADGCILPVADRSVDHVLAVECLFHFPSRKRFLKEAARVLRPGGTLSLCDFVATPGSTGSVLRAGAATASVSDRPAGSSPGDPPPGGAPGPGPSLGPASGGAEAASGASGGPATTAVAGRSAGGDRVDSRERSLAEVAVEKLGGASLAGSWYGSSSRPITAAAYGRLARGAGFDLLVDDDVTARTLPTYAALRRMHRESTGPGGGQGELGGLSAAANQGLEELMRTGDLGYRVLAFRRREA